MKNKLDERGNLYELNNDIKAFAKAVILSYDCFNPPPLFFFFALLFGGGGLEAILLQQTIYLKRIN